MKTFDRWALLDSLMAQRAKAPEAHYHCPDCQDSGALFAVRGVRVAGGQVVEQVAARPCERCDFDPVTGRRTVRAAPQAIPVGHVTLEELVARGAAAVADEPTAQEREALKAARLVAARQALLVPPQARLESGGDSQHPSETETAQEVA